MQGKLIILRTRCFLHQNISQLPWFKKKTLLQSKFCCTLKSNISFTIIVRIRKTRREPKITFPLNFFLMAVLNYSVVLVSELFCCLLTTPFEEKPFAFSLYISFEDLIMIIIYDRLKITNCNASLFRNMIETHTLSKPPILLLTCSEF